MIDVAIAALVERRDLLPEEAHAAMMQVMDGEATPAQIAGFLVGLRMKGETVGEITGCARAMRAHVTPARPQHRAPDGTLATPPVLIGPFARTCRLTPVIAHVGRAKSVLDVMDAVRIEQRYGCVLSSEPRRFRAPLAKPLVTPAVLKDVAANLLAREAEGVLD